MERESKNRKRGKVMKRYIAVLEIDDDVEIVGDVEAVANYTYRVNGTNYAYTESVEFKQEISDANMKMWEKIYAEEDKRRKASEYEKYVLEQNMQALK